MQYFKYVLLALVGATGVAAADDRPKAPVKALHGDVIVQPNGGAPSAFLPQDKKDDRRNNVSPAFTRRKKHRHPQKPRHFPK